MFEGVSTPKLGFEGRVENETDAAPAEMTPMNSSPYEQLSEIVNAELIRKVQDRYGITINLGGQGPAREDAITFTDTNLGGGTFQQELHIPDAWMQETKATTANEFIDKLRALL